MRAIHASAARPIAPVATRRRARHVQSPFIEVPQTMLGLRSAGGSTEASDGGFLCIAFVLLCIAFARGKLNERKLISARAKPG